MNNSNEFITIKTKDRTYLPLAFIVKNNEAGRLAIQDKKNMNLLDEGDVFTVVSFRHEYDISNN